LIHYTDIAHDRDHVASYRHDDSKRCALAFTGSKKRSDFMDTNFKGWRSNGVSYCGVDGVYPGFAQRLDMFLSSGKFEEFVDILNDHWRCTENSIIGFSLGGALATLLATCATDPNQLATAYRFFRFDKLYTFAAPRASLEPVYDRMKAKDEKCFEGMRVFYQAGRTYDPVPALAPKFLHPLLTGVQIQPDAHGGFQTYDCTSTTSSEASPKMVRTPSTQQIGVPKPGKHNAGLYADILTKADPALDDD